MRKKALQSKQEGMDQAAQSATLIDLAAKVASSFLANNRIAVSEVPALIGNIHSTLSELSSGASPAELKPAVPVKKSIGDDFIICLEDGKKLSMLKRYLRAQYNLSPEEYRKKWGLPHDYPMVAPAYARLRSAFAKKIGLGRTPSRGDGAKQGRRRSQRPS